MSARLPQLRLADVGCEDELVPALLVARSRVVLHDPAHRRTLRVPEGEPAADLLVPRDEVQLGGQPTVVPSGSLLQVVQMPGELLLRGPGRPVDPLEHRIALVTSPVGAGHPHQLEYAQPSGGGHMWAPAEVDEGSGVAIRADHRPTGHLGLIGVADDLALVGVPPEEGERLLRSELQPLEGLVGGDQLAHLRLDALEVLVLERLSTGELEVVVEAVLDRRADREGRSGPEIENRLCQEMGGRVPDGVEAAFAVGHHDLNPGPVGEPGTEVPLLAVDHRYERIPAQPRADRRSEIRCRGSVLQDPRGSVGEDHLDLTGRHERSAYLRPAGVPKQVREPAAGAKRA